MSWTILEGNELKKLGRIAPHIREKYEAWKDVVRASGPNGLRAVKGFHDEALVGNMLGWRSSRLSQQWRVIYRTHAAQVTVYVLRLDPHTYNR